MRKNGKTVVKGSEYQKMMQDYYYEKQKKFDFFNWAKPSEESTLEEKKTNNLSGLLKTTTTDLYMNRDLAPEGI